VCPTPTCPNPSPNPLGDTYTQFTAANGTPSGAQECCKNGALAPDPSDSSKQICAFSCKSNSDCPCGYCNKGEEIETPVYADGFLSELDVKNAKPGEKISYSFFVQNNTGYDANYEISSGSATIDSPKFLLSSGKDKQVNFSLPVSSSDSSASISVKETGLDLHSPKNCLNLVYNDAGDQDSPAFKDYANSLVGINYSGFMSFNVGFGSPSSKSSFNVFSVANPGNSVCFSGEEDDATGCIDDFIVSHPNDCFNPLDDNKSITVNVTLKADSGKLGVCMPTSASADIASYDSQQPYEDVLDFDQIENKSGDTIFVNRGDQVTGKMGGDNTAKCTLTSSPENGTEKINSVSLDSLGQAYQTTNVTSNTKITFSCKQQDSTTGSSGSTGSTGQAGSTGSTTCPVATSSQTVCVNNGTPEPPIQVPQPKNSEYVAMFTEFESSNISDAGESFVDYFLHYNSPKEKIAVANVLQAIVNWSQNPTAKPAFGSNPVSWVDMNISQQKGIVTLEKRVYHPSKTYTCFWIPYQPDDTWFYAMVADTPSGYLLFRQRDDRFITLQEGAESQFYDWRVENLPEGMRLSSENANLDWYPYEFISKFPADDPHRNDDNDSLLTHEIIDLGQVAADAHAQAGMLEFALHLVPFGTATDIINQKGVSAWKEAGISAARDAVILLSGGLPGLAGKAAFLGKYAQPVSTLLTVADTGFAVSDVGRASWGIYKNGANAGDIALILIHSPRGILLAKGVMAKMGNRGAGAVEGVAADAEANLVTKIKTNFSVAEHARGVGLIESDAILFKEGYDVVDGVAKTISSDPIAALEALRKKMNVKFTPGEYAWINSKVLVSPYIEITEHDLMQFSGFDPNSLETWVISDLASKYKSLPYRRGNLTIPTMNYNPIFKAQVVPANLVLVLPNASGGYTRISLFGSGVDINGIAGLTADQKQVLQMYVKHFSMGNLEEASHRLGYFQADPKYIANMQALGYSPAADAVNHYASPLTSDFIDWLKKNKINYDPLSIGEADVMALYMLADPSLVTPAFIKNHPEIRPLFAQFWNEVVAPNYGLQQIHLPPIGPITINNLPKNNLASISGAFDGII